RDPGLPVRVHGGWRFHHRPAPAGGECLADRRWLGARIQDGSRGRRVRGQRRARSRRPAPGGHTQTTPRPGHAGEARVMLSALTMVLAFGAWSPVDSTPAAKELARLMSDHEQRQLDERLDLRVKYGLPVEHLPDLSYASAQRAAERSRDAVRRLDALPPKGL